MQELYDQFTAHFGESPEPLQVFFAPGRVNLIGDHIDYHGGHVFPCAIDAGTTLIARHEPLQSTEDVANIQAGSRIELASGNFDYHCSVPLSETDKKHDSQWVNYPLAVLREFQEPAASPWQQTIQQGASPIAGKLQFYYSGNIPSAAGLSSSASVEVVTAAALNSLFDYKLGNVEIAQLCQRAENEFIGVQCGIMDQFAVACGKQGHAMKLNCDDLSHEHIPLNLGDYQLLLINTHQQRELSDSKYNERVEETGNALRLLQDRLPVQQLTSITPDQLQQHQSVFPEHSVQFHRARHVVTEQARVLRAIDALYAGDIAHFGELMFESHTSLDQDYEVSSTPLNTLVSLARQDPDIVGARLTGAGFGGCVVSLVKRSAIERIADELAPKYTAATGLQASFIPVEPASGVHQILPASQSQL